MARETECGMFDFIDGGGEITEVDISRNVRNFLIFNTKLVHFMNTVL
jgi:hypothetical protein